MKQLFSDKRLLNFHQRVNRLRCFTLIFLILVLVPISLVFYQGLNQIEKDQLIKSQRKADKVTYAINKRLFKRAVYENALSPLAFDYYQHSYNPENKQVTRFVSELATIKYSERSPGLIGYFQIDQNGQFNSPIWPDVIELSEDLKSDAESNKNKALALKLFKITSRSNDLKKLIDTKLPDLNQKFFLFSDVPDYLIFYRTVELNQKHKLQGFVIALDEFLNSRIVRVLEMLQLDHPLAVKLEPNTGNTTKSYFVANVNQHGKTQASQTKELNPALHPIFISQHELNWPFKGYKLTYSTSNLELTSPAVYSLSLMLFLMAGIILGCYGFYRIGVKQLKLAEQRLNFVSSVSHELKTPLTSIRMYSEMLKSGMVPSEDYKAEYYEFIHSESERLSRLIDNILQLSKLSQPQHSVDPHYTKLSILTDIIRSKVSSLLVNSDFQLNISSDFEQPEKVLLLVDIDAFSQVVINITDNAVKFFDNTLINDTNRQKLDFIFKTDPTNKDQILMEIRDYGNGITAEQQNKIFELFYRGGSELTRSTQGTGIGLALVNELVLAQQGSIEVKRMEPGLSMKMSFKCKLV
jgi:signal transduction histidine kinase